MTQTDSTIEQEKKQLDPLKLLQSLRSDLYKRPWTLTDVALYWFYCSVIDQIIHHRTETHLSTVNILETIERLR